MKKYLYITNLSGKRINRIWLSAILAAKELGYEVHLACNMAEAEHPGWDQDCQNWGICPHNIDFIRNPFDLKNRKAKKQLIELMKKEEFDIIHCNTPIGGLLGRICAKKCRIQTVIYQAHGFHFWKGAPVFNWLVYYPVEKWLSKYTDILITITKDDYSLAQHMHAKRVAYVHGIGINLALFARRRKDDRNYALREKIGIPKDAKVLLSVGELNKNKNHYAVFEALDRLHRNDIHYVVCGEGELREKHEFYLEMHGMSDRVHLVGFKHNVHEFYRMADLFVFPSLREGIPGAIMEAIATGVPVIASDIRGIKDIISDEKYRFTPKSVNQIAEMIVFGLEGNHDRLIEKNIKSIIPYSFDAVVKELSQEYKRSTKKNQASNLPI